MSRATLVIKNVDVILLTTQVRDLYDFAHKERTKAKQKDEPKRLTAAYNLDALLDMLTDAEIIRT